MADPFGGAADHYGRTMAACDLVLPCRDEAPALAALLPDGAARCSR